MADLKKVVPENVEGAFFVDTTCINCDTCRQLAPDSFEDAGEHSFVYSQPTTQDAKVRATRALLSCPTGSIGCTVDNQSKDVIGQFPLLLEDDVYYCGFNSPKSYGGNSFFIKHADGNWLIDSPKYLKNLVGKFEELGGIKYVFLTHQDDVADSDLYAEHFGASRIIHRSELRASPRAEIVIEGTTPIDIHCDFKLIMTPGHTIGHMVLLYQEKFLFTGDHLYYSRDRKRLSAFHRHCWYSWEKQIESMKALANYNFEWVLAGHGDRVKLKPEEAHKQLLELVEVMQRTTDDDAEDN